MVEDIKNDINGKSLVRRNDVYWRDKDTKIALNSNQFEEFVKCKNDIVYFLENYCKFNHPDKGLCVVELYDWQKDLLRKIQNNKYLVGLLPRQSGKSTTLSFLYVWSLCFFSDLCHGIVANKESVAKEIFSRVVISLKHVPHFLKPGVVTLQKKSIELDNGSKLIIGATSADGLSGHTINGTLLIDEVAKIKTNVYKPFMDSMAPTIARAEKSKLVRISTPVGMNHWYDVVEKSQEDGSNECFFSIKWDDIPGRDEKFKKGIIKKFGLEHWKQEYECKFLASADSLISAEAMERIILKTPIKTSYNGNLKIYKEPIKEHVYISVVDTSEGTAKDYSTISIIDISVDPMEQVATYRDNTIEPTLFPRIINELSLKYNEALLIVESNSIGSMILHDLMNIIEYENIYSDDNVHLGIRTTKRSKSIGCSRFKELVENRGLFIYDYETFKEISNFVYYAGGFKAKPGNHDDLIMGLVVFAYFTTTDYFKELKDDYGFMDKILQKKKDMITEQDMEIGFIHVDGNHISDADNDGFMF